MSEEHPEKLIRETVAVAKAVKTDMILFLIDIIHPFFGRTAADFVLLNTLIYKRYSSAVFIKQFSTITLKL